MSTDDQIKTSMGEMAKKLNVLHPLIENLLKSIGHNRENWYLGFTLVKLKQQRRLWCDFFFWDYKLNSTIQ